MNCFLALLLFTLYVPIVGLIKATIYTPIVFLISGLGIVGSSLILLPYDAFKAYSLVFKSKSIGINVRVLLILLLPIPILLWIPFVVLCCCLATIGVFIYTVFEPYFLVFSSNNIIFSFQTTFYSKPLMSCFDYVRKFWKHSYETFPIFVDEMTTQYYEGNVFEINIAQIFIGLIMGLLSLVIDVIPISLIVTIKIIPAIFRFWYVLWRSWYSYFFIMVLLFVPCVIITVLTPAIMIFAAVIIVLCSSVYNLRSVAIMYQARSLRLGLVCSIKLYMQTIYLIDDKSNSMIFGTSSLLKCLNFTNDLHELDSLIKKNVDDIIPILSIWNNFFAMCEKYGREALDEQLCSRDDIETAEPYIILGLPSLVFCRTLLRSKGNSGIILADGTTTISSDNSLPSDYISGLIYPFFTKLKTDFDDLNMTVDEYSFLERWLFTGGNEAKCAELSLVNIQDEERRKQIMRLAGQIQNISTIISRFPTFQQNFVSTCEKILLPARLNTV
jgi:hypothetical protein